MAELQLQRPRPDLSDNYICLKQTLTASAPADRLQQRDGWIGYVNRLCLIKYFEPFVGDDVKYPDRGCTWKHTHAQILEIETVAPLMNCRQNDFCEHVEHWQGISDLPDLYAVGDVEEYLEPLLL